MTRPDFAAHCRAVRDRHAAAVTGGDGPQSELPFCIEDRRFGRVDAMRQLRGTLFGLLAILFLLAAAITLIFTRGLPLQILAGLVVMFLLGWAWSRRTLQQAGNTWRREARAFPAALIMAHGSAHSPGSSMVPGAMLVDFGDCPDAERLPATAQRLYELGGKQESSSAQAPVRDWLQAEMQRARFGRLKAPRDLAGNDSSWLISLRLDRAMMPSGYLDRALWFVVARPDRDESAELLPHEYWAEEA